MVRKLVRGASVGCALWLFVVLGSTSSAAAQGTPFYNRGLRWIGLSATCLAPPGWLAEQLFDDSLPPGFAEFCLYTWTGAGMPAQIDVDALAAGSGARQLTEDVPVLYPTTAEEQYYTGLRSALRSQVGSAALLPSMPSQPRVRIAVVDSAPDAAAGAIHAGTNRHGDTLARLIEDLVCLPNADGDAAVYCAAEVTTVLALPWIDRGVLGPAGGNLGTLADLARAIQRAVITWEQDRLASPSSTPERLILNLSLGWEHTPRVADCTTDAAAPIGPPALAVQRILQHAAALGVLVVAAAGNDSGGPAPRTGLVCPGRFQALAQDAAPSQALLVAVSGLDYRDHPLETARPRGMTGIAALGLGGVGWEPGEPIPPQLTGSSVATAVVSAVSALVWTAQPSFSISRVTGAVYGGGVAAERAGNAGNADACPLLFGSCRVRRASVCGALRAAGVGSRCIPAAPLRWSTPSLPVESAALAATYTCPTSAATFVPVATIPRYLVPSVQVQPWTFPAPISVGCRACVVGNLFPVSQPYLALPERDQLLSSPVLVVRLVGGDVYALELGPELQPATPYLFPLTAGWVIDSAYLTGIEPFGGSVTEQIFVQQ